MPDPDPAPALARAALPAQGPARDLGETTAIEIPGLDGDDRETPDEQPPVSEGRTIGPAELVPLDEDELAQVDEMAAQCGMTREQMIAVLVTNGLGVLEGPQK